MKKLVIPAILLFSTSAALSAEVDVLVQPEADVIIVSPDPELASKVRETGKVLLGFNLNQDGTISEVMVIESQPSGKWDAKALEQLSLWSFPDSIEPKYTEMAFKFFELKEKP
jgi:TonB family protein